MTASPEHQPLTPDRHAAIVAYLLKGYTRQMRTAYRVLFMPTQYLFDDCTVCPTLAGKYPHANCGLSLMIEMDGLRLAFQKARDWDTAKRIIQELIRKDDQAYRMSIGVQIGDRKIMGEAV